MSEQELKTKIDEITNLIAKEEPAIQSDIILYLVEQWVAKSNVWDITNLGNKISIKLWRYSGRRKEPDWNYAEYKKKLIEKINNR